MSRSAYCKVECRVCGRRISTAGFADYNHKMKHVRDGSMRLATIGDGTRRVNEIVLTKEGS